MTKPADIKALRANATDVSALLKLLSHPHRLLIACDLTEGEKSVSEIEADTGISQPHVSRELARLRQAGLIVDRRQSKYVYYSIADRRLTTLIDSLCDAFGGNKRAKARS